MRILVIKHGALGDLIQATGAFDLIRAHHKGDHLTVMTAPGYASIMQEMGFFDAVMTDARSKNPLKIMTFLRSLARARFDRVYDLQSSTRTALYHTFLKVLQPKLEWSGAAPGCSHPQTQAARAAVHVSVRLADQLRLAGLPLAPDAVLMPHLDWLARDVSKFRAPTNAVLVMPGSSATGAYKRWTAEGYADVITRLGAADYTPVLIGGPDDGAMMMAIKTALPADATVLDLSGQTNFLDIGALARQAKLTIGNDTGPVHLAAAVGCPTLVLWSRASPPEIYAPRGSHVRVEVEPDLADLSSGRVWAVAETMLRS